MNANKPHTEYTNWQELYLPAESRWQDLKRLSEFILPIIVLVFFATIYAIGVTAIHFEDWFTASNNQFSYYIFLARIFIVVFLPVIAAIAGLRFIFKQTREFILTIYQPAEDENLTPLVLRRLLGIPPFPPPLNTLLKYPFIVIKEPDLEENHWARWFGGPATLVIYDGIALYLERGNKFSRVVGPGAPMPLLERYERIKEVIDLRPQIKTDSVMPWTKDGIRIKLTIRAEIQIDASPDALEKSAKFRYPFDPLAVKRAVEYSSVKLVNGKLQDVPWVEGAWGTITASVNAFVAGHSLDELFLAPQNENSGNSNHHNAHINQHNSQIAENIEQILSLRISTQVINDIQVSLQKNGIKIQGLQIIHFEVPEKVRELRTRYWESIRQKISAQRNSRAEAEHIRSREQVHAEAQRTMLMTIIKRLENVPIDQLTESLTLSLSGILDQGLDDPLIRPLIAKESFAVLDRVRKMLDGKF